MCEYKEVTSHFFKTSPFTTVRSNSKKNNGYDADRSTNLDPEEVAEKAHPVNGLTNGPGVHSEELNEHVEGKITVQV